MSPPQASPPRPPKCFPRVSGDEPGGTSIDQLAGKFSPRERG